MAAEVAELDPEYLKKETALKAMQMALIPRKACKPMQAVKCSKEQSEDDRRMGRRESA